MYLQPTSFKDLCLGGGPILKSLSVSYSILLAGTFQQDPPYLLKWERVLNSTCSEDQINQILFFAHKSSLCSKYQTSYKILTRQTPSVFVSIFPGHSPLCWRCGILNGTIFHRFAHFGNRFYKPCTNSQTTLISTTLLQCFLV